MINKRWYWLGDDGATRAALASHFGSAPVGAAPVQAARDGVIVIAATAAGAGVPTGHAFGAVRAFKEAGHRVYVVVADGDRTGVQLARFCLADGVLMWNAATGVLAAEEVAGTPSPRRAAVDALLARLEPQLGSSRGESSLQRLLRFEREDTLLNRLQDPETGLFDGPYATLKLDEEWKRAHRFHQPLSLVLLDLGLAGQLDDSARRQALAEAAGVFLNECRDIDVLARFAPTVFLFLLPGTGPAGAEVLANRTLSALRGRLPLAASSPACGISSVPSSEIPDRRAFLAIAEACLQRAVAGGGGLSTSWQ